MDYFSNFTFRKPIFLSLPILVISISLTLFGVDLAVKSAVYISKELEIPDSFIGLSLVAIGTSLPELVTSISAAKRGNNQIIFGNIIGSNILNLVIIVPIIGLFSSAVMPIELWERDSSPLIILTLTFTLIMLFLSRVQMPKYLGTLLGFGFISFYMIYVLNLSNLISIF